MSYQQMNQTSLMDEDDEEFALSLQTVSELSIQLGRLQAMKRQKPHCEGAFNFVILSLTEAIEQAKMRCISLNKESTTERKNRVLENVKLSQSTI